MSFAYEPSRSLPAKLSRRVTPFLGRRMLQFKLERPLISFTFDDCPVSAITNGVEPLAEKGWKSTIYVSGSLLGQTNHHGLQIDAGEIRRLAENGHEIAGHTFSHIDAQSMPSSAYLNDIERNQNLLKDMGVKPSRTFAYPYGQTLPGLKKVLESRFDGLRGIQPGIHQSEVDLNQIKSVPLFTGEHISKAQKLLSQMAGKPAWITFFTHDIRDDHSPWGCSPAEMQSLIQAAEDIGAEVLPVEHAIKALRSQS